MNAIAKDLRTPKYKKRVVRNKKKYYRNRIKRLSVANDQEGLANNETA